MDNTLISHNRGYRVSFFDALFSLGTGLSGAPYALRHYQLAKICKPEHSLGHHLISALEFIPIIGAIAGVIERITVLAIDRFFKGKPVIKDEKSKLLTHKEIVVLKPEEQKTFRDLSKVQQAEKEAPKKNSEVPQSTAPVTNNEVKKNQVVPEVEQSREDNKSKSYQLKNNLTDSHYDERPYTNQAEKNTKTKSEEKKCSNCTLHTLSIEEALEKMIKNSKKVIDDHRRRHLTEKKFYAKSADVASEELKSIDHKRENKTIDLKYSALGVKGDRDEMEDYHFYKDIDQGIITGVLDGHGGYKVAEYVSQEFPKRISKVLENFNGNVLQVFEQLIHEIQVELSIKSLEDDDWSYMGTTAVICFIHKKTNLIYTATVGDSEANIYRYIGNWMKSIPLSGVRNWAYPKEAARAAKAMNNSKIEKEWPKSKNPKKVRFLGINVSRAIGDIALTLLNDKPGVIHKAIITAHEFKPGDVLVLASDGLKDFVTEREMIDQIGTNESKSDDLAKLLVDYAINEKESDDNVTVIAIKASEVV